MTTISEARMHRELNPTQKQFFRDQLREARLAALRDAEAFEGIVHVIERLGSFLRGETEVPGSLEKYKTFILAEAKESPLARKIPSRWPGLHVKVSRLYELVQNGRNKAIHEGAFARHLTSHAIELSIVLEHALMSGLKCVGDFMVREPVCAAMWQPLSFIRQNLLKNSFSYLPVADGEGYERAWRLVSDLAISKYLHTSGKIEIMRERLSQPLEKAVREGGMELTVTRICRPTDSVASILENWDGLPLLVCREKSGELIGILTPFDLL